MFKVAQCGAMQCCVAYCSVPCVMCVASPVVEIGASNDAVVAAVGA